MSETLRRINTYKTFKVADVEDTVAGSKVVLFQPSSDFVRLSCAVREVGALVRWRIVEYFEEDGFQEVELYNSGWLDAPQRCEARVRGGQLRAEITWTGSVDFELTGTATNDNTPDPDDAAASALLQLQFHEASGGDLDDLMINDNGEILHNDFGQLLEE